VASLNWVSVLATVLAAAIVGVGGLVLSGFNSHAKRAELDKIETESKARDMKIREELHEHLGVARKEALDQARFRGAVKQALKIEP